MIFQKRSSLRMIRRALVHQRCRAILQNPVHDVRVPGNPTDVRRAPVNVVFPQIEDVLAGQIRLHRVAARGVHQAFGFSRRPRRIEDVQRILGIQFLRRTLRSAFAISSCHQWSRPACISTGEPERRYTTTFFTVGHCAIASSTVAFSFTSLPRRYDVSWVRIATHCESFTRSTIALAANPPKITECTAPIRAQARMRNGQLRRHAHVHRNPVALFDPEALQRIRKPLHLGMQLAEGQPPNLARLAFPQDSPSSPRARWPHAGPRSCNKG